MALEAMPGHARISQAVIMEMIRPEAESGRSTRRDLGELQPDEVNSAYRFLTRITNVVPYNATAAVPRPHRAVKSRT